MDDLAKNKRRAMRRKRNLIARDMKMSKQYHEKKVPGVTKEKRPRAKLRPQDIAKFEEDYDDEEKLYIHRDE